MPVFKEPFAVEKDIKSIDANDNKVRLLGVVISKNNSDFVIDDGTGTINVHSNINADKILQGQKVRVFGRAVNGTLFADIIQDMTKLNIELYNKAKVIWNGVW